jgi:predicted dehydrogenase
MKRFIAFAVIADSNMDLVYVGTPHSHHYDVTKEAIIAGKPCLVEKAFMANVRSNSANK